MQRHVFPMYGTDSTFLCDFFHISIELMNSIIIFYRKILIEGSELEDDRGSPLVPDGENDEDRLAASPSPQGEDESLNAYIERLENLQARLGTGKHSMIYNMYSI